MVGVEKLEQNQRCSERSAFHPLPFPPSPSARAPMGGGQHLGGISIASEEIVKGLFNCQIKV